MPYLGRPLISDKTTKTKKIDSIASSFNGAQTVFSLNSSGTAVYPASSRNLFVSINGVLQEPDVAYTINAATITFTSAPTTGATFFCVVNGEPNDLLLTPSVTTLAVGTNVSVNATTVFVGNTTTNTVITGGSITINGTAVGTTTKGSHNLFIPAAGIRPLPTGGAGSIEDATSTNNISGLPFDPTTSEGAYFWLKMPKSWNEGTITAKFVTFNKAGGSGNFVFNLAGMAASDDDSISTALGTAQQVTDGALAAYDVQISAATSAITLANTPNAGDYCLFVVKRLPADAADTYASDVYLAGVELTLTTDAENDD